MTKIGVFLPNWIGDVVMATPALRALRNHFTDAHITGIMKPYVGDVLAGTGWLDETWQYNRKSDKPEQRRRALLRKMKAARFDKVFMLPNSLGTAILTWLSGAKERHGYVRYGRGPFLTHKLYPPKQGRKFTPISAVDYYLDLAFAAGCPSEERRMELATLAEDEQEADRAWEKLNLPSGENVVVLNSGGAFGTAKHWPVENCANLSRRIATELNMSVLVFCGPAEEDTARQVTQMADHPNVVSLADYPLRIGPAKAAIRRSRMMVSTDSGPRHIAVAFGLPTVTMFGPILPQWSHTYSPREVELIKDDLDCLGCAKHDCPLGHHRCMVDLTVNRLFSEVQKKLKVPARKVA